MAKAKFKRVQSLSTKFNGIVQKNNKLRTHKDSVVREHADALHLIMHTGMRPGSETDTKAHEKAYGATTIEGRHVVPHEGGVALHFVGKKGVENHIPVHDSDLKNMLTFRAKSANINGKIFPNVNEHSLLRHVKSVAGTGFKTKDFRTHLGTSHAIDVMKGMEAPKDAKEYKRHVATVAKHVSGKLGNTPTVALQSYIHPAVFSEWRSNANA
jgi:DNA topoisomerase-1